jgi:hypothetical protein
MLLICPLIDIASEQSSIFFNVNCKASTLFAKLCNKTSRTLSLIRLMKILMPDFSTISSDETHFRIKLTELNNSGQI